MMNIEEMQHLTTYTRYPHEQCTRINLYFTCFPTNYILFLTDIDNVYSLYTIFLAFLAPLT